MFDKNPQRPAMYERFVHPTPAWFKESGLGIFVHWGAYAVPAWAEPIGALGAVSDMEYWFAHNPYAEWYFNTIRIEGAPARAHHHEVYDDAPYDDFLDMWKAEAFDPSEMVEFFARAGARYVVPTTKHHDGICLWDAPGTGVRNTVKRGPGRDLVAELAEATRAAGLRFGAYYSTGIDWHAAPMAPITDEETTFIPCLPQDETYARYVHSHLIDLVDRYAPDMLWSDIGYPRAGQVDSEFTLARVLDRFYTTAPEGVINDRWGVTHWDFRTSEYERGTEGEGGDMWQRTRGIGFSFGYNQVEGPETYIGAAEAVKELVDIVSRGGNLLLNVGPNAAGRIPDLQRQCLEGMAAWMAVNGEAVHAVTPAEDTTPSEEPWVRWTATTQDAYAVVNGDGDVSLACDPARLDAGSAALLDGRPVTAHDTTAGLSIALPAASVSGPQVVRFRRK